MLFVSSFRTEHMTYYFFHRQIHQIDQRTSKQTADRASPNKVIWNLQGDKIAVIFVKLRLPNVTPQEDCRTIATSTNLRYFFLQLSIPCRWVQLLQVPPKWREAKAASDIALTVDPEHVLALSALRAFVELPLLVTQGQSKIQTCTGNPWGPLQTCKETRRRESRCW